MEYKSITSVIEEELDSLLVQGLEWDICYSFFFKHRLDLRKYKETACKVLLRYLSAFGMTSRTAFFVRWNYHDLKPLIEYCINHPEYYNLDLNKYEELIALYKGIEKCLEQNNKDKRKKPTATAVTKVMLAIYGCVPAFDSRFCKYFKESGFTGRFNESNLRIVNQFYCDNKSELNNLTKRLLRNAHYQEIDIHYPVARLIDCYGWHCGV